MTRNNVAAWTGFVNEAQFDFGLRQLFDEFIHGLERAADDAVMADFGGVGGRDGHGNRFFVDV